MSQKEFKPDVKDKKILFELDINARQSNAKIGKKVRLSKEVVKYRIDRMMKSGLIARFCTIPNYFRLGMAKYKLYLRLKEMSKDKLEEIGQYFFKGKKTEWVVICTGRWDMIVSFIVHNINEFDDEVQGFMHRFSSHILDKATTTTLHITHQKREYLTDKKLPETKMLFYTSADKQEKIDNLDEEILKILANNARMPIRDIAKRIKTTARKVQYRIKELERKGVILTYKVHVEPRAMGNIFCKAIVYLSSSTKQRLNQFVHYASSLQGVVWPQRVIGNWDFEIDFELENYEQFQDIMFDLREKFSDIIMDYEFCIVSKEYKLDFFPGCYRELD